MSWRNIPTLSRVLGDSDANYLYPRAIYSLNRVLQELLDELKIRPPSHEVEHGDGDPHDGDVHAWVVPYFFDCHKRTWHFACVQPKEIWDLLSESRNDSSALTSGANASQGKDEIISDLALLLCEIACGEEDRLEKEFDALRSNLLGGRIYKDVYEKVQDTIEYLEKQRSKDGRTTCDAKELSADDDTRQKISKVVDDLLMLYFALRNHRNTYIPGIYYRSLLARSGELWSHMVGLTAKSEPYDVDGNLERLVLDEQGADIILNDEPQFAFPLDGGTKTPDIRSSAWAPERGANLGLRLATTFYLRHVLFEQKHEGCDQQTKEPFVLIPIHDVWVGSVGYGGLWGALLCTFPDLHQRAEFIDKTLPRLLKMCEVLADELAMSTLATIAGLPFTGKFDLVEHFVQTVIHVQDWERICVFNGRGQNRIFQYAYCRGLERRDAKGIDVDDRQDFERDCSWKRCEYFSAGDGSPCADCGVERVEKLTWDKGDRLIWTTELMPELGHEELSRFKDVTLEFYYPATASVPRQPEDGEISDRTFELFELAVIRQQIEVLRLLIPKVRARRAALRAAVSGIMGRNMSHNIGSHVLSRYSSMIKKDLEKADRDHVDHRSEFLGYLQRRMDFLAEVATSGQAFWEQPLSLRQAVEKLNYISQLMQIKPDKTCHHGDDGGNVPILLTYISGKESISASVEWGQPGADRDTDDVFFSCPGGEVGVHALYVILENVIRNSARHANYPVTGTSCLKIYIEVGKASNDRFVEVTVIDPRTRLDGDGWVLNDVGKRTGDKSLTDHVNRILTEEPILDDAGVADPRYWGLREMQICAQYLRKESLADLENEQNPHILRAIPWNSPEDGRHCLAYRFFVGRAKLVAYVDVNGIAERVGDLEARGIHSIQLPVADRDHWRAILSEESEGYAFLAVPENEGLEDIEGLAFPVRTIRMPCDALQNVLARASETNELDYLSEFHLRVIERYCEAKNPGDNRWLARPIQLVVAWDCKPGEDEGGTEFASSDGEISVYVTKRDSSNEKTGPFRDLPKSLPSFTTWPSDGGVGLAWLDHPNNDDLVTDAGGYTRAASIAPEGWTGKWRNWASVEPIWGASAHTSILKAIETRGICADVYELAAAALARVVVLDERIQSRRRDVVREVTLFKYWPQVGLWSPMHPDDFGDGDDKVPEGDVFHDIGRKCDLDNPDFWKIRSFLTNPTKLAHQCPADFLVIHLTILERLNQSRNSEGNDESLTETLRALVRGTACDGAEYVIVTGRGRPTVARYAESGDHLRARYLPVSALQEYLVARPSKLGLMRALWASAAPPDR